MADTRRAAGKPGKDEAPACRRRKSISMHEDVPVWYDCCSCEAEPYWAELAEQPDAEPSAAPAAAGDEPSRRRE